MVKVNGLPANLPGRRADNGELDAGAILTGSSTVAVDNPAVERKTP